MKGLHKNSLRKMDELEEEMTRYLRDVYDRDTTVRDVARHFAEWQKDKDCKKRCDELAASYQLGRSDERVLTVNEGAKELASHLAYSNRCFENGVEKGRNDVRKEMKKWVEEKEKATTEKMSGYRIPPKEFQGELDAYRCVIMMLNSL